MLMAMLLITLGPGQRVAERIEAALPPVAVETRGLVNDRPRLEVDMAALFDDAPLRTARRDLDRVDEVVERMIGAAQEARRDPSARSARR